jgi:hypothetical protein
VWDGTARVVDITTGAVRILAGHTPREPAALRAWLERASSRAADLARGRAR